MQKFIYKKLLVFLVLFQPIIDIITSFMTMNNYKITLGIILKVFILLLAVIYLVIIDKEKRKTNFIYLFFVAVFLTLNIYNNLSVIKLFTFTYFNYLFKYAYHLIILLFFLRWYKVYKINLYNLRIPMIIIVLSYFISLITNTAYLSYDVYRLGYSGWYSSANELGNLLVLLFPVAIYNAFHNKDGIKLDILLVPLIALNLLLLGTKVGLFGFYCVSVFYLIIRLIFLKKIKIEKGFVIVLLMVIGTTICINKLPTVYNIRLQIREGKDNYLLSGREKYYEKILAQYKQNTFRDKMIGLSYYEDNEEKSDILIVEQDFFDILFMYGIIGLLIVIIIYSIIYVHFIKTYIYYRKLKTFSKKYLAVIIAISIEFAVAFISGHSLLSPSVSTYLSLLIAISLSIEYKKSTIKKKSVLISSKGKNYLKIDKGKYDVYVLGEVDGYNSINKYSSKKIFNSRIFRNKMVIYLLTRNQKYDYAICDSDDYFERKTILYANAKRKFSINKSDEFNEKITIEKFNRL